MPTIPCPECGMPRAEELFATVPCPVCGPAPAFDAAPPPPPPEPAPIPAASVPTAAPRSQLGFGLVFCAGLIAGIGLALGGQAIRSESRAAAAAAGEAPAAPATTAAAIPALPPPPVAVPEPKPSDKPLKPISTAPIPHPRLFASPSTGLEMVLIEPGEFQMGSWHLERARKSDETEHRVRITQPFYMGVYEVTQEEFAKTMERNPSWFSLNGGGRDRLGGADADRLPVEMVTWYDAVEFCNRLSAKDGLNPHYTLENVRREDGAIQSAKVTIAGGPGYRLPTEAEWEYACRAGSKMPFHYGSDNTGSEANVKAVMIPGGYGGETPRWKEIGRTAKIGSYPRNRWLLRDMHGNVAEWCWDFYEKDYYTVSPVDDPTGPETGHHRVIRGGSWVLPEPSARAAARYYLTPDDRKNYVGFRVARTP